ncbi:uncharacterized protein STEHIDRAFT_139306 [Stereum hirsutum FP-91666 SS1]|uniref:uncharacterized protein n=1 Tax=Stereum hirsutum (strain FP-91666) TaxID=721885 RepID=UPI000440D684|nr:uncharacterized protein STEHIDRAFT_139306 [Stereum hirsutum FP-91666 SS1]EIM86371.1 hypothetical protein STEHIDRAFT_139306 [Stereum hirsutum FP-91666 SS1]
MSSSSHSSASPPAACAHLTGIMSLEEPRSLPNKPRTVLLNAGIYVGPGNDDFCVGLLRYYNDQNINFKKDGDLYFVTAKVVKMREDVDILSQDFEHKDYDVSGDIIEIIPIVNVKRNEKAYGRRRCLLTASGSVSSVEKDAFLFLMEARQWTNLDHDGVLPITARIAEKSKWPNRAKALPNIFSIVTFTAPLVEVERDEEDQPTRFVVDIDRHLDFLGVNSSLASSSSSPERSPKTPKGRRMLRFHVGGTDAASSPTPSPRALEKRRAEDSPADDKAVSDAESSDAVLPLAQRKKPRTSQSRNSTAHEEQSSPLTQT